MLDGELGDNPMFYRNQNTNSWTQENKFENLNNFIDGRGKLITTAETSII